MSRASRATVLVSFLFSVLSASPVLAGGVRGTEIERVLQQIAGAQKRVDTIEVRVETLPAAGK